jgi:hypothetical protein
MIATPAAYHSDQGGDAGDRLKCSFAKIDWLVLLQVCRRTKIATLVLNYHACPITPFVSLVGYFERALDYSDWSTKHCFSLQPTCKEIDVRR